MLAEIRFGPEGLLARRYERGTHKPSQHELTNALDGEAFAALLAPTAHPLVSDRSAALMFQVISRFARIYPVSDRIGKLTGVK
jgi:hypothetical protein